MEDKISQQDLENNLEKIIAKVISKLGIPAQVKGYHYCKCGIMILIINNVAYLE